MFKKYKNLSKISKYYKKDKKLNVKLVTVMFSGSFLGMLLPYAYSQRLIGVTDLNFENVVRYALLIVLIISFHHTFWYLWSRFAAVVKNNVAADIRKDIMEKMLETKYSEVKHRTTGFYMERMNDDVMEVAAFFPDVMGIVIDCVTNFSFMILIFFISYKCGLLFLTSVLLCYGIDLIRIKEELKYTQKIKVLNEAFNTKINENVKGLKDIKGLGIKKEALAATTKISQEIASLESKKVAVTMLLTRIETYSHYVAEAILVIYAVGVLIPKGELEVVELLLIINYSGFMYELIGWIAKFKEYFEKGDYKAGRLLEILESENVDKFGDSDVAIEHYGISVKDLSFAYEDNQEVTILNHIQFSVKENSANVFLGLSGSGKTTLFGILTKILSVEDGKIFIGETDINGIPEKELRDTICIINQEPFLLHDTILNNIRIVKPDASLEEVYAAAQMANIYDEIKTFKEGFDTMVIEGGNNLSGGQKQRIAIARALLKDSKILLFDEPTSALDKENQEIFYNIIHALKKEKTILIIAHKYNDLDVFDNVFELEEGVLHKRDENGN